MFSPQVVVCGIEGVCSGESPGRGHVPINLGRVHLADAVLDGRPPVVPVPLVLCLDLVEAVVARR